MFKKYYIGQSAAKPLSQYGMRKVQRLSRKGVGYKHMITEVLNSN